MKGRYTTISSASHGYQYTQHCTLVPHFEAGDMRIPNLAQKPRGVPFTGEHLSYLGGVATLWDSGLVPETLIVECPTAYVPSRNAPPAVWGRRYQPPVIL